MKQTYAAPARPGWLDCTAGVSGDMLLGAFVGAGVPLALVQQAVDAVVPGLVELSAEEVRRAGLAATRVHVLAVAQDHPHRSWVTIRQLLTQAALTPRVRELATQCFEALAVAEGAVHGCAPDDVEFHEVGAWDSIADIVGVCAAYVALGEPTITASVLEVGTGSVRGSHGDLPVPAPATTELLRGMFLQGTRPGECATPTGVALVRTLCAQQGPLPQLRVAAVGVGAGGRDPDSHPNVCRLLLGDAPSDTSQTLTVLETNIDDLDPRLWPGVIAALLRAGALDAWLTPIVMKKGRPAHTVSALAEQRHVQDVQGVLLGHTTALGVRSYAVQRVALQRTWVAVPVGDQVQVSIKVGHEDGVIVHVTPEFDSVVAAAEQLAQPVADVLTRAVSAAVVAGLVRGARVPDPLA